MILAGIEPTRNTLIMREYTTNWFGTVCPAQVNFTIGLDFEVITSGLFCGI
jgi:hypothetical protein